MRGGPKTCTKCKKQKPVSQFRLLPSSGDKPKYKAQCKDCERVKKTAAPKRCKHCGKHFNPFNSLEKYCSPSCRGKANPNYKPKKTFPGPSKKPINQVSDKNKLSEAKFTRNRAKLKKKMLEEHGFLFCQRCTRSDLPLETHHIVFRSEKPGHPNLHDLINLILVCTECHDLFHKVKKTRVILILERGLQFIFNLTQYL